MGKILHEKKDIQDYIVVIHRVPHTNYN